MHILQKYFQETNECILNNYIKGKKKISDDECFIVPNNIEETIKGFSKYNYNVKQLKLIAKEINVPRSGNKCQLQHRIISYCFLSLKIILIQKSFRRYLVQLYLRLKGKGLKDRSSCLNEEDVGLFINLKEIPLVDFFSYTDKDDFTYGFEINTFEKIMNTTKLNPYNRTKISIRIHNMLKRMKKIRRIIGIRKTVKRSDSIGQSEEQLTPEQRAINLFDEINTLGNYAVHTWFLELSSQKLLKFIRELSDIWNYRANLSNEVKRQICPQGDPFENIMHANVFTQLNLQTHEHLQHFTLDISTKMVTTGIDSSHKSLGAMYVLSTLTMVNENAAHALPWLYESVALST